MDFEDIVESKFFYYFIQEYIESKHYEWFENNRLIYIFCKTTEERLNATKQEIFRIGNKIREAGFEEKSIYFLDSYDNKYPIDYSKKENEPNFWEHYFYDYFVEQIETLTPITEKRWEFRHFRENGLGHLNERSLTAIEKMEEGKKDFQLLIDIEDEIIEQIEADISDYKKNDYWEFYFDFYRQYTPYSSAFKLLFDLIDLLTLLYRSKMFEDFLEVEIKELNNESPNAHRTSNVLSDSSQINDVDFSMRIGSSQKTLKKTKSTIGFLNGSETENISLLNFLIENYKGQKGKYIAIMILALKEIKLIAPLKNTDLYSALRIDFGNIGANSGINKYMTIHYKKDKYQLEIVALHIEKIKKHIENTSK